MVKTSPSHKEKFFIQIYLSVIDADPSSIPGTIKIMDHLQKYVPTFGNDKLCTIPTHGDVLSVERTRDAKATRATSFTARYRLEDLNQFHKNGISGT